jgi:hypothetical protein
VCATDASPFAATPTPSLDCARPRHYSARLVSNSMIATTFRLREHTQARVNRGVATVASAVTADGLPRLRGQGLVLRVLPVKEPRDELDRCDAGRVLADHRVRIAAQCRRLSARL